MEQIVKLEMLEQDGSARGRCSQGVSRDFSEPLSKAAWPDRLLSNEESRKDMDLERTVRTAAMSDLSAAVERRRIASPYWQTPMLTVECSAVVGRRRHDVNEAEYFETWRYEAALEAFHWFP